VAIETRPVQADVAATVKNEPNVPLQDSPNEGARKLVNLHGQLINDPAQMNAAASAYGRRRPFLLSEALATEVKTGFMPGRAKSTLRGAIKTSLLTRICG